MVNATTSETTRGAGALAASPGASIAHATVNSSIFGAGPFTRFSEPPNHVRICAASCSAAAPAGFAASAADSPFGSSVCPRASFATPITSAPQITIVVSFIRTRYASLSWRA